MIWSTMTGDQQRQACESIVSMCLAMGATLRTAHLVAGRFAEGLDRESEQRPPAAG